MEVYDLGFDYRNFMTRTSSPKVDRYINREMGIAMNTELPEVLATAREAGMSAEQTAAEVGAWISAAKADIRSELKNSDKDTVLAANVTRFRGQPVATKKAALTAFKKESGGIGLWT